MMLATDMAGLERFRAVIARRLGLLFEDAKLGFLAEILQDRLESLGESSSLYLRRLEEEITPAETGALGRALTIGETYFFRNHEQFDALAEIILPARQQARGSARQLRILSAGCASGEEAYTIAMVARAVIDDPRWAVSIRAVDLNPAMLEKATRARYSSWALRETPAEIQGRWFRAEGRELMLDPTLRDAVRFEARNLAEDDANLWPPNFYDVIFCRNVIMYFAPDQARALMARIAASLAPGGYLFLGHAETMRGLSDAFHLHHTHGTFYYERKEGPDRMMPRAETFFPHPVPVAASVSLADAWVDAIQAASARVEALIPTPIMPPILPTPAPRPAWDMAGALALLRNEQFSEALAYIQDQPPGRGEDPDLLLLEAMLLAHGGALAEAEAACQRLLALDDLNAGAHYVLALCRENAGERASAAEHDQVAVYLDPGFAMPRLHLGLLARRAGERDTARRELEHALILLRSEDASRLLLFGGGFNREALIALCGSALRDCGGRA